MHSPLRAHVSRMSHRPPRRRRAIVATIVLAIVAVAVVAPVASGSATGSASKPSHHSRRPAAGSPKPPDGLGIQPGKIKHVWLIILENKSYEIGRAHV